MNIKRIYLLITSVAILLFICLWISVFQLSTRLHQEQEAHHSTTSETIYVYDSNTDENTVTPSEEKWLVKEYNGIIGIFGANGELLQVIDTYTKALPSKDQALLREGFEVFSKKELNSVIEAYSD